MLRCGEDLFKGLDFQALCISSAAPPMLYVHRLMMLFIEGQLFVSQILLNFLKQYDLKSGKNATR